MGSARSETEWGRIASQYVRAKGEDKTQLALEIRQSFGVNSDARAWLHNYLSNPGPEDLLNPNLAFVLFAFAKNPTREEISLITKYWNLDNFACIFETSYIIQNGRSVLSEQERKNYAHKAKRMADEAKQRHLGGYYNYGASLVNLVADFEGAEAVDWFCKIIESEAINPTAGDAWGHALKFSPEKTAQALLINLKTSPSDYFSRMAWVVERIMPVMDKIEDERDLILIIDTAVKLATNVEEGKDEMKNLGIKHTKDYVIEVLRGSVGDIRRVLEKLSPNHPSRINLENLLKQLT